MTIHYLIIGERDGVLSTLYPKDFKDKDEDETNLILDNFITNNQIVRIIAVDDRIKTIEMEVRLVKRSKLLLSGETKTSDNILYLLTKT